MVVKSHFKQKIIFVVVFLEIRYSFEQNLKLALGTTRDSRNIFFEFFTVNQKQETTKTINYNFFSGPEKLERYCKQ